MISNTGLGAFLKLGPDLDKHFSFTDPAKYSYNADEIEFTGTSARPKDIRPLNSTFHANYNSNVNANWCNGLNTGILKAGATVHDGVLDLTGSTLKGAEYSALSNLAYSTKGCVRLNYIPNYTGNPAVRQQIFGYYESSTKNKLILWQNTNGLIYLYVYDRTNVIVINSTLFGTFGFTSGVTYELELNWDFDTGVTMLFINGLKQGATITNILTTLDNTITKFYFGYNLGLSSGNSNFKVDSTVLFSEPQHSVDYTPFEPISETIYTTYCLIETLDFLDFVNGLKRIEETAVKPLGTEIKYQLTIDGTWKYYHTTENKWKSITLSQTTEFYFTNESNSIEKINEFITTIGNIGTLRIRIFMKNSNNYCEIDDLFVTTTTEYISSGTFNSTPFTNTGMYLSKFVIDMQVPSGTTIKFFYLLNNAGAWIEVNTAAIININQVCNRFDWKVLMTSTGLNTPELHSFELIYDFSIFSYDGWNIDKSKVALYTFGDSTKLVNVEDSLCQDAITMLKLELDKIQAGLSLSVDKTDPVLNMALTFFAACLMVKSGLASQRTGMIQSESMEGMSISYGQDSNQNTQNKQIPKNWCDMALDTLFRYASAHGLRTKRIRIAVVNMRDKMFEGIYDKNKGE